MRRPSGLVLGALAWVVVVVAVSVVTWVVIARAGQDVAQVATAPRVSPTSGSTPGPGPSRTARTTTGTPTTATRTATGAPTTATRTATGAPTTATRTTTSAPGTSSTPTASPPPRSVAGFTTGGGTVRAECVDGAPRVRSVTPKDGFSFEISRDESLEVTFRGGPGTEDEEIKVRCENGIPTRSSG